MTRDELLPATLRSQLPALYAGGTDPMVYAKFFYPDFSWTWYAYEFDGDDIFYGLVDGFELECGTFSLRELLETRGKRGFPIERDLSFTPMRLSALYKEIEGRREMAGHH